MKEKQIRIPGPDHPISIERNPARVVVSVARHVVADTRNALTLREADYSPVQYIPPEDVDYVHVKIPETILAGGGSSRSGLCGHAAY
jgi:uncharacterized protein (DUF427 family)